MRINILLLTSLLVAGPALAGEAHVCKSQTVANSAANAELTDNTVFKCGESISGTIPALVSVNRSPYVAIRQELVT